MAFPTVNLSWTSQPGAVTYELERSANDSGVWSAVATINHPTVSYADNPATDTDWSYRVRAVNSYGNSAWSNVEVAELSTIVNLDANDLSNGDVASWPDRSHRNTLVYQPESGYRPERIPDYEDSGYPAVYFTTYTTYDRPLPSGLVDAVNHLVLSDISGDLDAGLTLFFVGGGVKDTVARPWFTLDAGSGDELRLDSNTTGGEGLLTVKSGGSSIGSNALTFFGEGGPTLYTVRISASAIKSWGETSSLDTGSMSAAPPDTARNPNRLMAGLSLDEPAIGDAYLQELLVKNRAMSDSEVAAKQAELMAKWGIT